MSPLNQQLTRDIPWLFGELGFTVIADEYDPKAFGDCIVILKSASFRARFIKDRGQILLDLAPGLEPDNWWGLGSILNAIHREHQAPDLTLEAWASLFRENYPALVQALGPKWQDTKHELQRRAAERLYALQHPVRTTKPDSKFSWLRRIFR
jgi:hypothetical protein